ncbi:MAG: HDOD domain-containing protein [Armatimonadetes bacterium]|nr:HDOD domain-containing protein [Armatimonadota bacterium]
MELASLEIRIARNENLPVLSQAVSTVLRLVDNPNISSRNIENAIEKDPAITAKVLKVANSAYYGGMDIPSVGRAVQFLGLNTIRSLVVGIALQQMISDRTVTPNFSKLEFWSHCLAVATAARILCRMKLPFKAEELYCAGMMHDVGMLVMDRFMSREFQSALDLCRESGRPLYEIEREIQGYDHAEIGGLLATNWSLSKIIMHGIRYHHDPALDGDFYETTCVIAVADAVAHQCGYTNNVNNAVYEIDEEAAEAIGLKTEQLDTIKTVVISEVNRAQEAFRI